MKDDSGARETLPAPTIRRTRWPYPLIWLVPLAAAVVAGVYFRDKVLDRGPIVTIHVADANGIDPRDTAVRARGVEIGNVVATRLGDDQKEALIDIRLHRNALQYAKKGANYWVVKADIGSGNLNALTTALSGQYLAATPGDGEMQRDFNALERAPLPPEVGLHLTLIAADLNHLGPDAPVYYRGILAGSVRHARLAADASGVDIDILIRPRYQALIRADTVFWRANGADVKGGIFSGIDVKVGSIRSLLSGGINFATPGDGDDTPAPEGAQFSLHEDEPKGWQKWAPNILVVPDPAGNEDLDSTSEMHTPVPVPTPTSSSPAQTPAQTTVPRS